MRSITLLAVGVLAACGIAFVVEKVHFLLTPVPADVPEYYAVFMPSFWIFGVLGILLSMAAVFGFLLGRYLSKVKT